MLLSRLEAKIELFVDQTKILCDTERERIKGNCKKYLGDEYN